MTESTDRRDRITKWVRWVARIWSVPLILYALIFFIGYAWSWLATGVADPHAVEDYPPIENLPPIFISLSVLGLAIAWRWEQLGAVIALVFEVALLAVLPFQTPIMRNFPSSGIPYLLALIVAIPGVLFLVCALRSSREALTPAPSDRATH